MTPDLGLANSSRNGRCARPSAWRCVSRAQAGPYGHMQRCIENCAARLRALGVSAAAKPNKRAQVGGLIDPQVGNG